MNFFIFLNLSFYRDAVDVLGEVADLSNVDVLQPGSDLTAAQQAQVMLLHNYRNFTS